MVDVVATGMSTTASWYEVWEGIYTVAAVCVRKGRKGGKFSGLGTLI